MKTADEWDRIVAWCDTYALEVMQKWNAGATEDELHAAETRLGVTFPAEMRELYRIHDGQKAEGPGTLPMGDWLSLEDIYTQWGIWKNLLDSGTFAGTTSEPVVGVRNDWWNPAWIPITHDGGGNHYCVDLAPAEGGTVGQIITMLHDEGSREIIAPSLAEWLHQIAGGLEDGTYVFSPEGYAGIVSKDDLTEDDDDWRGVGHK